MKVIQCKAAYAKSAYLKVTECSLIASGQIGLKLDSGKALPGPVYGETHIYNMTTEGWRGYHSDTLLTG